MDWPPDPHDVLRVEPDADEETIKDAYRRRVKETHPDQGGSRSEFKLVKAAYEAITAEDDDRFADRDGSPRPDPPQSGGDDPGDADESADWSGRSRWGDGRQARTRVEYLDYEFLVDQGWALEDDDLFTEAAAAGLPEPTYGEFVAEPGETLLEAAENRGFSWPFSCRGGACANCAVAIVEGELSHAHDHVLPEELTERGIQLACIGTPTTAELRVVYNVKHLPELEELLLPPRPGVKADD